MVTVMQYLSKETSNERPHEGIPVVSSLAELVNSFIDILLYLNGDCLEAGETGSGSIHFSLASRIRATSARGTMG